MMSEFIERLDELKLDVVGINILQGFAIEFQYEANYPFDLEELFEVFERLEEEVSGGVNSEVYEISGLLHQISVRISKLNFELEPLFE